MKMLVAEDNRASRVLLEKLLKLQGHDVLTAENGREALDLFGVHGLDDAEDGRYRVCRRGREA
jgi:CheY-like chemotaxis protein